MKASIAEDYAAAAGQHGECTERGDYRTGNKAYERIIRALNSLRALPDRGEEILLSLLNHTDDWVKIWSATHLLPLRAETACDALERLAAGGSRHVASDAKIVLQEWRAGRLTGHR